MEQCFILATALFSEGGNENPAARGRSPLCAKTQDEVARETLYTN
jgi:hypothetical protein